MATSGKVDEILGERMIEWKITNFSVLLQNKYLASPAFSFAGASWYLAIRMCSSLQNNLKLALNLKRDFAGPPINVELVLGLKSVDHKKDPKMLGAHVFSKEARKYEIPDLITRAELVKRSDLLAYNILCVFCTVRFPVSQKEADHAATVKCAFCNIILEVGEDISSHEQNVNKRIKLSPCSEIVILKDSHECHMIKAKAAEKVLHDLKILLLNGDHSDVTVKVNGEEFRLHRNILASRNPFFYSMFKNDMKENATGIVSISECKTDIFRSFIHYVYVGQVDKLSAENVCDLYEIADKYQEDQLKEECLYFMLKTLNVDSFCDFMTLALIYNEKKLFQNAVELFTSKGKEIARNVKWQNFMVEYPREANELFIKALDVNGK